MNSHEINKNTNVSTNLIEFITNDFEQTWTMIRHSDTMRLEWIKFYFGLITATGGILMTLSTFSGKIVGIQDFIQSNLIVIIFLLSILEIFGILSLIFHLNSRVRNVKLLLRIDELQKLLLNQSIPSDQISTISINPKWISYSGTDATITYMFALLNTAFATTILALLLESDWVIGIISIFLFVVFIVSYFFSLKRNEKRYSKEKINA